MGQLREKMAKLFTRTWFFRESHKTWTATKPLLEPKTGRIEERFAVKDPTFVRHEGRWHIFYSGAGFDPAEPEPKNIRYTVNYVCAPNWIDLNNARRYSLEQFHQPNTYSAAAP